MSYIHVLLEYLIGQFPCLQGCRLVYDPASKTLYVDCQHLNIHEFMVKEIETISLLDIGVAHFIITVPNATDIVRD
ncbi:hypothetical protein ACSYAD_11795 [Acaryochloris marina NIES-2412]|uniref:hypothetical protein n=1 Tax=Acaryochloris marina TaxID=155978 RepID=UPI00405A425D